MRTLRATLAALVLATAAACGDPSTAERGGGSASSAIQGGRPAEGRLLFATIPPGAGDTDIFAAGPGASPRLERLTDYAGPDNQPVWSPDGSQIAFVSDRAEAENMDIYVMNADGTGVSRVTEDAALDSGPAWAPDGLRIAFERTDASGHAEIYVVSLADGSEERLTSNDVIDAQPDWSPDGATIAFMRNTSGDASLMAIDVASGGERQLTDLPGAESNPSWSPDGLTIAYARSPEGSYSADIWFMSPTGTDHRPFSTMEGDQRTFAWSPDGDKLAFLAATPAGQRVFTQGRASSARSEVALSLPVGPPLDL